MDPKPEKQSKESGIIYQMNLVFKSIDSKQGYFKVKIRAQLPAPPPARRPEPYGSESRAYSPEGGPGFGSPQRGDEVRTITSSA